MTTAIIILIVFWPLQRAIGRLLSWLALRFDGWRGGYPYGLMVGLTLQWLSCIALLAAAIFSLSTK